MKLKIEIAGNDIAVRLCLEKKLQDQILFSDINNLSDQLLPAIDELLKRNKIAPEDIKKIDSKIDIPESYTAGRIAQSIIKGLELKIKKGA